MKFEDVLTLPPPEDWNKVVDGHIHIPDAFDDLVNSVGLQLNFNKFSGLSDGETIANIVASFQRFILKIEPIDKAEPDVCQDCGHDLKFHFNAGERNLCAVGPQLTNDKKDCKCDGFLATT